MTTCVQVRAPLEKKLAEDPGFMQALAADVAALEAELAALQAADGQPHANGTA